jgi:hypothetical protein
MTGDWSTVEALMRGLGSVKAAADALAISDAAIARAITEAAEAIGLIHHPGDREAILRAHDALKAARCALATLKAEVARSTVVRSDAHDLAARSQRLMERSAQVRDDASRALQRAEDLVRSKTSD